MDIKEEREAFETWLYSTEKFKCRNKIFLFMLDENGCYEDNPVLEHWETWQAAKAVPEKDAVIKKLSDQLYAQEMKASAARVLCETACELLDDYAHQDAMVILNDLEQAMKEPVND